MNKKEIAETLRTEVGAIDDLIKKLMARSERLKAMLYALEAEFETPISTLGKSILDGKLRKTIDAVFCEKPKQPKR